MNRQLTLKGYRLIDLSIFTTLMVIFEFIAVRGINWFNEVFSISLFITISLMVMMRWGLWSIFTVIAGAITYCLANGATWENYLVYVGGNLFILINLCWFLLGKARIREGYTTVSFVITGFILVELGRSIMAMFVGGSFIPTFIAFLGTDSLNALLALLIIMISRRQNGLFEDQIAYIKRINEEERKLNAEV